MSDDEKGPMPSLTLIFTTDDEERADWDCLLDLADVAIDAIELADPRFHILKSFTFYAGTGEESQHTLRAKLTAAEARISDLELALKNYENMFARQALQEQISD